MNANIVVLAGNLVRDPEQRFLQSGTAVCNFGIAVNRRWRNDAGEQMEEVSFFDCVAFGKTAENIAQYFKKGNSIFVEGRLKQESWDDKQTGAKRYAVKVIVATFQFTGAKTGGERAPGGQEGAPRTRQPAGAAARTDTASAPQPDAGGYDGAGEDSEVPF